MAVGLPLKTTYANGDVYSASDVNDTNGTINLFQTSTLSMAAAKNYLINGGQDIWQRGTSVAVTAADTNTYTSDRWMARRAGSGGATITRQATGDTTNLPNIQYCARVSRDSGNTATGAINFTNGFESANSIPFAGKTVTISFYARKGANYSATSSLLSVVLQTGTGTDQNYWGYTGSAVPLSATVTLTTTWQRFTQTVTLASTATELGLNFQFTPVGTAGAADYYEITGVQLELGSYATTFSRAGGTIQGELAACQRYYIRWQGQAYEPMGFGWCWSGTTQAVVALQLPVQMRVPPTAVDFSTLQLNNLGVGAVAVTSLSLDYTGTKVTQVLAQVASGLTANRIFPLITNNSTSGFRGLSSEL